MSAKLEKQRHATADRTDYTAAARQISEMFSGARRETQIWWTRTMGLGKPPTLQELGERMSVTRERVRQLEAKGSWTLRRGLTALKEGPAGTVAAALAEKLGPAYLLSRLRWKSLGITPSIADEAATLNDRCEPSQIGLLLLHLAGPYRVQGRWLVREDIDIFEAVRGALAEVAENGILSTRAAHIALRELGIVEQFDRLLEDTPGIKTLQGKICFWPDTAAGRVEAILRVQGRPVRPAEIATAVGRSKGTIANLVKRSPRFTRVGKDSSFGLAEWGMQPYSGIISAIRDFIKRQGGEAHRQQIIDDLTVRYSIAENSINVYLDTHHFFKVGRGVYRVRSDGDPIAVGKAPDPQTVRNAFMTTEDQWMIRLDVNDDRVRGSGYPLPRFVAEELGLTPNSVMFVPIYDESGNDLDMVRCTWPSQAPAIGSLALVVETLGLGLGDYLFLRWADEIESFVAFGTGHPGCEEMSERCAVSRIAALIGRADLANAPSRQVLQGVSQAIGVGVSGDRTEVIRRLQRRQDDELPGLFRTLYDLEALRVDDRSRRSAMSKR